MKTFKTISVTFLALCSFFAIAQQGINYKALVKDSGGNVVANQNIEIQFQILEGAGMVDVYQETHLSKTDTNGIVIVNIGEGITSDDFSTIEWGSDDHFLNVQIDTGSGLTNMGTTQFMVVPYALNATKANNVTGLEALDEGNGLGWRLIGTNSANYGNIGLNSVDLSYSSSASSTQGATGNTSTAMGYATTASGLNSTAMGYGTTASGIVSTAIGIYTDATSYLSTAIGSYNIGAGTPDSWVTTDPMFEIGIGTNNGSRANALTVLKNGTITAPSLTNDLINTAGAKALTTKEYVDNSATGLEALDEGNGMGWRLIGKNPSYYGNIGSNAVDLSYSNNASSTRGATGNYSTALGAESTASGYISTAMGYSTTASGNYSIAMGSSSTASGYNSTALGISSTASGYISTAMGNGTTASGDISTTMGNFTNAASYLSTAIGTNNVGGGTPDIWVATDPLFEIGNGTYLDKSNALTVLKNGNTTMAGSLNVNQGISSGVALRVNGSEALWFNGTSFSWGYGGTANYFADDIGIGTSTPATRLQILGGSDASLSNGSGIAIIGSESSTNIVMDSNEIMARNNGANSILYLQNDGGSVYVGGILAHSSDRRLKQGITNLSYGLREVMALRPVAYYWKSDPNAAHKTLGFIAQEVQPLITDLVSVNSDREDTMSLDYNGIIAVLTKAIQEQQQIIEDQKAEIKSLKSEFDARLRHIEETINTAQQ